MFLPRLTGPTLEPASGAAPRQLVILLHGFGADGNDLIGLAPHWAPLLPDAAFIAPHAPFPCAMGPFGRQWFGLESHAPDHMHAGARGAAPALNAFIDQELAARGLTDAQAALVGFSQGTMMALYAGLRRSQPVAGILGYSGTLVGPESLAAEIRSRPPVLLVHGDADSVVNFGAMAQAAMALQAAGVPGETLRRPGLGHAIDEEGLERGGAFLRDAFARTPG